MEKFLVSYSPYARSTNDTNKMFLLVSIMLVLPAVYGVMFFGLSALFVILVALISSVLSEMFYNLLVKKTFKLSDTSSIVTGMILGLTMPAKMPLYIVALSGFVAVFIAKNAFGGLGKNKFNPALVGRIFASLFASYLSTNLYELTIKGETMVSLSQGGTNSITNLLAGSSVGGIGTTSILLILVALVFLIYSDVLDWKIPVVSVISYFLVGTMISNVETTLLNICSGSFFFVSVFMMTDPNTSPNSLIGKILYSVMFGALSAYAWHLGFMGEDTVFVVALFVNLFVPTFDKYLIFKHKPLGGYRNAYKN